MTTAYLRYIHKISQRPEQDTVGPLELPTLDLVKLWPWLRKKTRMAKDRRMTREHRAEGGGLVYFLSGTVHSLIVMPIGSDMHKRHAPPSHFEEGGPLHGDAMMSGQSPDSPVNPEALDTMRARGQRWAAYRNEDMSSTNHGHMQFLQIGPENTFKDPGNPPEQYPFDTRSGLGWRYRFIGMVNVADGMIVEPARA